MSKRQNFTFNVTNGSWSTPQQVRLTGSLLARSVLRGSASASVTSMDIMVWGGVGYGASTNPDNVPDEDRILYRTTIAVTGSATAADDDYNILGSLSGAVLVNEDKFLGADNSFGQHECWVSVKGTAGSGTTATTLTLYSTDG